MVLNKLTSALFSKYKPFNQTFVISRYLGKFPFKNSKLSRKWYYISVIILLIELGMFPLFCYFYSDYEKINLLKYLYGMLHFMEIINNILNLYSLNNNQNIWNNYDHLHYQYILQNNIAFNKINKSDLLFFIGIIVTLLGFIVMMCTFPHNYFLIILSIILLYFLLCSLAIANQFCKYIEMLNTILVITNKQLIELNININGRSEILQLVNIHSNIIELAGRINDVYSKQNLLICMISFTRFTTSLYNLILKAVVCPIISKEIFIVAEFTAVSVIHSVLKIIMLTTVCEAFRHNVST